MLVRNLSAGAVSALVLAACGGGEPAQPPIDAVTPPAVEAPVETPAPEPVGELFDGASVDLQAFDPQIGLYTLNVTLESAEGIASSTYSDTTPPMPFASSSFAVYAEEGGYLFQMVDNSGERYSATAGSVDEPTEIEFVNTLEGAILLVNGEVVWTGERTRPLSEISWGRGFRDRFWTGRFINREVCLTRSGITPADVTADPSLATCPAA